MVRLLSVVIVVVVAASGDGSRKVDVGMVYNLQSKKREVEDEGDETRKRIDMLRTLMENGNNGEDEGNEENTVNNENEPIAENEENREVEEGLEKEEIKN